jgi:hypothetical protein
VTRNIVTTIALLLSVVATAGLAVACGHDVSAVGAVDAIATEARFTATSQSVGVWVASTAAQPGHLAVATTGSVGTGCTYDGCSMVHVDGRAYKYGGDVSQRVSGPWNESDSRTSAKLGPSTTSTSLTNATNTAGTRIPSNSCADYPKVTPRKRRL